MKLIEKVLQLCIRCQSKLLRISFVGVLSTLKRFGKESSAAGGDGSFTYVRFDFRKSVNVPILGASQLKISSYCIDGVICE